MPKPKKPTMSFNSMLESIASGLSESVSKPNIYTYNQGEVKNEKQLIFHHSDKRGRLYVGGNRSGKTVGGVVEAIWWLTGRHPYLNDLPEPPVYGRLCTVDFKSGWEKFIKPVLKQWLPPSELINGSWEDSFDKVNHVLTLANGSQLEIMSYDQELEKFAGVPRHFVHYDEQPPKDIYTECQLRLIDYNGRWWMTMTPLEGMDWTYDVLYLPALHEENPLVCVVEVEQEDNPFINQDSALAAVHDLGDEEQVAIRRKGKYIPLGGVIFTNFDEDLHTISIKEFNPDWRNWTLWESYDHGFGAPAAWLWHAVHNEEGVVVTFDMHYKREMLISQHSEIVHAKEKLLQNKFGITPYLRVADPAIEQRNGETGISVRMAYAQQGINMVLGRVRDKKIGLDRMNTYFLNNKWFICQETCQPLIKEIRKYRRKRFDSSKVREKNNEQEEPVKKDDHAIDSSRYFFTFQPVLNTPAKPPSIDRAKLASLLGAGSGAVDLSKPLNIDMNLVRERQLLQSGNRRVVRNYDSNVGEF